MGCTSSTLAGDDFKNIDASASAPTHAPPTKPAAAAPKRRLLSMEIPRDPAVEAGRSFDDVQPRGEARRMVLDGQELTSTSTKTTTSGEAEPKKASLYQRYMKGRVGVGEERDPVTGRGKITGMTLEETIAYVRRTRGSGMMGDKHQYFVGGYQGLGAGSM